MEFEPLVKTRPDTLADAGTNTLGGTLGDVEAKAVVDTLINAQPVVKAETLGNTPGDIKAETLVGRSLRSYSRRKPRHLA